VQVMIRYKVKPDQLERELDLLRGVYEELEATRPDGVRYASFQLEDEVSFVEFAETDRPGRFSQLDERCEEPPVVAALDQVRSFGFAR
jgi:hypothetical protein